MLKKLKHAWRMVGTAWHYYLIYLICCYAHPIVCGIWHSERMTALLSKIGFVSWLDLNDAENAILPWLFTLAFILVVSIVLYAHHCYTKWYHGDK